MEENSTGKRRWHRFEEWDARPLRLDSFADENPEDGFAVFHSPYDPSPSLRLAPDGSVLEMDGRLAADFDILDAKLGESCLQQIRMPSGRRARRRIAKAPG